MEGFLELLVVAFVIWAWARAGKRRAKRPPPSQGGTSSSDEGRGIDWDEAIGDVLERFGLPKPERPQTPPGAEARRLPLPEAAEPTERATPGARPGAADREVPGRDRTMLEIAGLAETAARRRRDPGGAIDPTAGTGGAEALPTTGEPPPAPALSARPSPTRLPGGLPKLDQLSELERAVVYAEILGRPKALSDQDEPLA